MHAMSDIGFTGRNNAGSAVLFENTNLVPESGTAGDKIMIHKPHPVPKIDPVILHLWGNRMAK